MTAVILCGGFATRLMPISATVPKAMVHVAGEPFVAHQLRLLRKNRIREVVLCTGHLGDAIERFVGDGAAFDLRVRYSRDGPAPLGTGGALRNALPLLGDAFFVLYGDTYLDCDHAAVEHAFVASNAGGLLTVAPVSDGRFRANVALRGTRVARYHKTRAQADMKHMYWGLGAFRSDAIAEFAPGAFDLGDVFVKLAARGDLAAYEVAQRHYEIGCPDGLSETEALLVHA